MAKTAQIKSDRRKPAPRKKSVVAVAVTDDLIAARAFEYYCSRGGEHGRDIDDWLAAERELKSGPSSTHA